MYLKLKKKKKCNKKVENIKIMNKAFTLLT